MPTELARPQETVTTVQHEVTTSSERLVSDSVPLRHSSVMIKDVASGAAEELFLHPVHLVEQAAAGAGLAAVAKILPGEAKVVLGIGLIALAAGNFYQSTGKWWQAAETIHHLHRSSPQALQAAHRDLQGLGAGLTDLTAAGLGGGFVFGRLSTLGPRATAIEPVLPSRLAPDSIGPQSQIGHVARRSEVTDEVLNLLRSDHAKLAPILKKEALTNSETLDILSNHSDHLVRTQVADHPNATAHTLERLIRDEEGSVRQAVVKNIMTNKHFVQIILDGD